MKVESTTSHHNARPNEHFAVTLLQATGNFKIVSTVVMEEVVVLGFLLSLGVHTHSIPLTQHKSSMRVINIYMKSFKQFLEESVDLYEEKDACYRKIMKSYGKWSARAAQATAKCRKSKGKVKKSKEGSNLKRWGAEKWKDTKTGKPCGAGGKNEYCRPTKRVSKETPKTTSEMSSKELRSKKAEKSRVGMHGAGGRKVSSTRREK